MANKVYKKIQDHLKAINKELAKVKKVMK